MTYSLIKQHVILSLIFLFSGFLAHAQPNNQVKLADQEWWEVMPSATLKRVSEDISKTPEFIKLSKAQQNTIRSLEAARKPIIADAFRKFGEAHAEMRLVKTVSSNQGFFALFFSRNAEMKERENSCESPLSQKDHSYILAWNEDGSVNTQFGDQGVFDLPATQLTNLFLSQGKLLVAGYYTEQVSEKPPQIELQNRFFVRKYLADGKTVDPTFANHGVLTFPQSTLLENELCGKMAGDHQLFAQHRSAGDFVVLGALQPIQGIPSYFLTRYDQNGQPMKTFGSLYAPTAKIKIAGTLMLKGLHHVEQVIFSSDGGLFILGTLHSPSRSKQLLKGFFIYDAKGKSRLFGLPFVAAPEIEFSK